MEYVNKVTVITPEAFNEFYSDHDDAVKITGDRMLMVTVIQDDRQVQMKVYAPGEWSTVETELVQLLDEEEEEMNGAG